MPNWCENELEIYGDRKTIKKIKQEVSALVIIILSCLLLVGVMIPLMHIL